MGDQRLDEGFGRRHAGLAGDDGALDRGFIAHGWDLQNETAEVEHYIHHPRGTSDTRLQARGTCEGRQFAEGAIALDSDSSVVRLFPARASCALP